MCNRYSLPQEIAIYCLVSADVISCSSTNFRIVRIISQLSSIHRGRPTKKHIQSKFRGDDDLSRTYRFTLSSTSIGSGPDHHERSKTLNVGPRNSGLLCSVCSAVTPFRRQQSRTAPSGASQKAFRIITIFNFSSSFIVIRDLNSCARSCESGTPLNCCCIQEKSVRNQKSEICDQKYMIICCVRESSSCDSY